MKILRDIKNRLMPQRTYSVELKIHSSHNDKYIGRMEVTTTARNKTEAANNIKAWVTLHIGKVSVVKKQINGHQH